MVRQLHFITSNKHKLSEVTQILGDLVELQSQPLELCEIQGSIEEISLDKCRRAAEKIQGPVLVEDTCLCFNALQQLPGPKWFLQALGHQGLNNLLAAYPDKTAQAVCTFAYCEGPGHEPLLFQGRTDGKIVNSRGPTDFGWDAIFEYEGKTYVPVHRLVYGIDEAKHNNSYAEMDKSEKNQISHRFRALEKLKTWLQQQ